MKILIAGVVLAALFASPAFARSTSTVPPEETRMAGLRPLSSTTQQPGQFQAESFRGSGRMVQFCVPPEEDSDDAKLFCRSSS
jgi:hypothetical protein